MNRYEVHWHLALPDYLDRCGGQGPLLVRPRLISRQRHRAICPQRATSDGVNAEMPPSSLDYNPLHLNHVTVEQQNFRSDAIGEATAQTVIQFFLRRSENTRQSTHALAKKRKSTLKFSYLSRSDGSR